MVWWWEQQFLQLRTLAACSVDGMEQALPHHCSLTTIRVGKEKTGAIPSPQISAGAIADKPAPNLASSRPPRYW